jgi:hypothetical protein
MPEQVAFRGRRSRLSCFLKDSAGGSEESRLATVRFGWAGGRRKKRAAPKGAARTNYLDLFYLVVFAFDGSRRPDCVFGEVLPFLGPAFVSLFLVSSARTVAPTLARSIL